MVPHELENGAAQPLQIPHRGMRDDPTAGKLKLLILFGSTSLDQITTRFSSRALPRNPTGDESS